MTIETLAAPDRKGVWAAWDSLSESWRAYLYAGSPSSVRYTHWRWLGALPTEPPGPEPAHLAPAWRWVTGMQLVDGTRYTGRPRHGGAAGAAPDFACPYTRALALVVLGAARGDDRPYAWADYGEGVVDCCGSFSAATVTDAFAAAFWAAP